MSIGRFGAGPLRGISALLLLGAVAAASLLTVLDALGVEGAADDLVADTGKVLHPAAANEHDRVLLKVVTDARDVSGDLDATRQAHAGDLAESGVRLLRGGGVDAGADATALRRPLQGRRLVLRHLVLAALADQLVDSGHLVVPLLFDSLSAALCRGGWCCRVKVVRYRPPVAPEVGRVALVMGVPASSNLGEVYLRARATVWSSQTRGKRLPGAR